MKKLIVGYAGDRALPDITAEAARKLTHLNVAFGHVREGEIQTGHLQNLAHLKQLRSYNPDLKILLSVGGWSAGGFSEAASTEEGRRRMALSAVRVLKSGYFDGVDLDWEYPCYAVAGIGASPADKRNFTLLLKEMREELDKLAKEGGRPYLLTIAAGADEYYLDGTEMEQVQAYLDYVQLMTYDMRGGFQTLTGHHTNLFAPTGDLFRISVARSVQLFGKAGVPREKLVIGAAFYSRMWKEVPDHNRGLHQMTPSSGGYGPEFTALAEGYINRNGYVRHWDDEAKAPYLFDGSTFITYDDEESLHHKCAYVLNAGLAGVMFWEYSCDKTLRLLDAIHKELH
ncbi:glycoside hydrolase family 18 protein [Paenibacillus aurantius]|uniref:chitinase n=1 Tax=Paenibacillus aurantius TaxID=2918900 RepID=A0AA96LEB5_9BACL|nr:glycoside hydrolase family 18 protein [Paenibacillus aurantius]WNQ10516.1 glycoside hydrolase family 18 protein [Paenibacillus aurantius]